MISLKEGMANPAAALAPIGKPLGIQRVSGVGAKAQTQPRGRTVRPVRGSMNGSEKRYAAHLERMVRRGELAAFWFEPLKFRLADKTWFTVDFMVMLPDGLLELHELKGFLEDDAAVKLKVQSEAYWQFPVKLVREKPQNVFTIKEVGR